jgi:hypothetical protein
MRPLSQEEQWRHERWVALALRVCDMERRRRGDGSGFLERWKRRHGAKSGKRLRRLMRLCWRAEQKARIQTQARRQPR